MNGRQEQPLENPMNVLDRFRLDGKRLFITGGSRGFGRSLRWRRRGRRRHRAERARR
jgi:hypothetical protein